MKCEACAKREAPVAYTHIVDDVKKTQFVCSVCAGEKAPDAPARPKSQAQDVPELVKETKVELPNIEGSDEVGGLACTGCGMGYDEFKKAGRLGCHECYRAFELQLERLLKRIHGASQHLGKGPIVAQPEAAELPARDSQPSSADHLDQLRDELAKAVSDEAFEEAAQLRDRIRELEDEQGS